ncbi:cytochrome-c peroxidase [Flavisolibacter tropicus]|uniref:Cytochrome C peroxidase n=1 Tax=Flavisolibacter tropicus TaxID=1492898 RepID=A0A172U1Z5_9BACT|nr:cytochrome c peroxidase [Flavisolibacter tropicus]ANE53017.1 cytochrome C peroxidase [Flavisolibacter tropicus]
MKKLAILFCVITIVSGLAFRMNGGSRYNELYTTQIQRFIDQQDHLLKSVETADLSSEKDIHTILDQLELARLKLKENDFWLRYLNPILYRKINGPLPIEWETEVFEKFEKPYKRTGAGLTLTELYLGEKSINKDSLISLIQMAIDASKAFEADSITHNLLSHDHFFLANRLFILNLASIYTTGFECPNTKNVIVELRHMLVHVKDIYQRYNQSFSSAPLTTDYLDLYDKTIAFVNNQPSDYTQFNHFSFIKDYVNGLFKRNQQFINAYSVTSTSYNDYTLSDQCFSIFDKSLYQGQNTKGIYSPIHEAEVLNEIKQVGKLLFFDPILSGNNKRSCASCHKPDQYFTDTSAQANLEYGQQQLLSRNTISLMNVTFNHLIMMDGRHISLQDQATEVMMSGKEMNSNEKELIDKVLSCKEYKEAFKRFLKRTPEEKQVTLSHINSALTLYYGDFSNYYSPFDDAINNDKPLGEKEISGFNLFMSKAQCATCHFVPQFNGVKPPFISSEFEVIGVPEDAHFAKLSSDSGRYKVNPAGETLHAFRTGTLRNAAHTKPYMHNGVLKSLEEVLDFYDAGGGVGKKLDVGNQTLSADSLKLTPDEKEKIIAFIHSLSENSRTEKPPLKLPASSNEKLNLRKVGGEY